MPSRFAESGQPHLEGLSHLAHVDVRVRLKAPLTTWTSNRILDLQGLRTVCDRSGRGPTVRVRRADSLPLVTRSMTQVDPRPFGSSGAAISSEDPEPYVLHTPRVHEELALLQVTNDG